MAYYHLEISDKYLVTSLEVLQCHYTNFDHLDLDMVYIARSTLVITTI